MKFLDSHILSSIVGAIIGITGIVAVRRKNNSEANRNESETVHNRSQTFLNEIDYLTKDRDRYREWFHQGEEVNKALKEALNAMKREYEQKIVDLEHRCNELEEKVAQLIAQKH